MFEKLGRLLPSSIKKSGEMSRGVEAAQVVEAAQAAIRLTFGAEVASHAKAASFKAGTLRVSCDRSVYAETVRLREDDLVAAVNKRLGRNAVSRIRST